MRKQIITALLTISVSVAIIAGCGTKKPLQTDNSVSSEQGSSVDEMEPSSDYSEDTPEAGTDPSGERENDGEGTASGTDMDAVGRELFKEVLDRYCDYATNGWDEDGEESYMFWHMERSLHHGRNSADSWLMWLFPMAHAIPWLHYEKYLSEQIFPIWGSYVCLSGSCAVLIVLCIVLSKKYQAGRG